MRGWKWHSPSASSYLFWHFVFDDETDYNLLNKCTLDFLEWLCSELLKKFLLCYSDGSECNALWLTNRLNVICRVMVFLHWSKHLCWEKGWNTAPLPLNCLQDQAAAPQVHLLPLIMIKCKLVVALRHHWEHKPCGRKWLQKEGENDRKPNLWLILSWKNLPSYYLWYCFHLTKYRNKFATVFLGFVEGNSGNYRKF